MRADIHTHALVASHDSRMTLDDLIAAAAAAGVDGLALTDHLPGSDFASAHRGLEDAGIAFIPGREVSCALGHVLVLATDTGWLAELPARVELPLPTGRRGPAAVVWAHPAGWRSGGAMVSPDPSRGAAYLHGIEVLNGERLWQPDGVSIARSLARELGLASCGGSDAHDTTAVGRCLTEAEGATDALSFIEALLAGEVRPVLCKRWAETNDFSYERADLIGDLR